MGPAIRLTALDLGVMLFPAAIGTVFGSVLLLAAIALRNKMAGSVGTPGSVAAPSFAKALGITFATALINAAVGIGVAFAAQATPAVHVLPVPCFGLIAQAVALPLSLLIMAAMLTVMLPTSVGRALVITLLYLTIGIALTTLIAVVLAVAVLAIRLAIP